MADLTDFDAFTDEVDASGPTFRMCGREWTLPADVPADVMARLTRLQVSLGRLYSDDRLNDADEIPEQLWDGVEAFDSPLAMLRILVGEALVDELASTTWTDPHGTERVGPTHRQATKLAGAALHYYQTGEWQPGNPPAPKGAKQPTDRKPKKAKGSGGKTSSSTGARSKPTSNANTASTS